MCRQHGAKYVGVGVDAEKPYGRCSMGVALNIGIKRCMTRFIVSACADIIFGLGFSDAVLLEYEADPDVLVTCRHYDIEERHIPGVRIAKRGSFPLNQYDHTVIGASRKWWFALRGFDERYAGCFVVDNDLVDRAKTAGMHPKEMHNNTEVYHVRHGPRIDQGLPRMFGEGAEPNGADWGTINRVVDHGMYGLVKLEARPWP